MWTIEELDLSRVPGGEAWVSDGASPVGTPRGGAGQSVRLMIGALGSIDITDMGNQGGGPAPSLIMVGPTPYWNSGTASMSLAAQPDGSVAVSGDGNAFTVLLDPYQVPDPGALELLDQMVEAKFVPYPTLPPGGRPYGDVIATAGAFFAWSGDAAALGLAVYDWTTADFFRMDIFNFYRYTALPDGPLSQDDIVNAIWTASWPPYVPSDPNFMGSMLMQPASSREDVASQYPNVAPTLQTLLDALKEVTAAALAAMPRTSTLAVPNLYSGQVDVSNLGEAALATYFLEYPGNAGPVGTPMGMDLEAALAGFMAPGQTVTLKSFLSTTDSEADALHYSNGILLLISPAADNHGVWSNCAYVTPLSNEAVKTEYLFGPGSAFVLGQSYPLTVGGKTVTVIPLTCAA